MRAAAAAAAAADRKPRAILVCGDCADAMRAELGAKDAPVTSIRPVPCQAHPLGLGVSLATQAVVPPEGWGATDRAPWGAPANGAEDDAGEELPEAVGPLTQVSVQLLASWTSGPEGMACADEVSVQRAVYLARSLLRQTGGR